VINFFKVAKNLTFQHTVLKITSVYNKYGYTA